MFQGTFALASSKCISGFLECSFKNSFGLHTTLGYQEHSFSGHACSEIKAGVMPELPSIGMEAKIDVHKAEMK